MKSAVFTFLFCLLLVNQLQAQQTLEVYKRGTKKYYYFPAGDSVRLKVKGVKEPFSAPWGYIGKDRIWLADTVVALSAISWIDISEKNRKEGGWDLAANLLLTAGIGYFAVDQVNLLIERRGRPAINRQVAVTSAGLVGGGLLIKLISRGFKKNKARMGRKYRLRVVDST